MRLYMNKQAAKNVCSTHVNSIPAQAPIITSHSWHAFICCCCVCCAVNLWQCPPELASLAEQCLLCARKCVMPVTANNPHVYYTPSASTESVLCSHGMRSMCNIAPCIAAPSLTIEASVTTCPDSVFGSLLHVHLTHHMLLLVITEGHETSAPEQRDGILVSACLLWYSLQRLPLPDNVAM